MQWLRRLVDSTLPHRPEFNPGLGQVRFMADKVAM